jgi:purine-binding chemotaxis protein CheW
MSGYWRRSSEDWRCRRCGYIWAVEAAGTDAPPGPTVSDTTAGTRREAPVQSRAAGLTEEDFERILKERAEDLAKEVSLGVETDTRILMLFSLSDEWYAVDVASVREIKRRFDVTVVPGTPAYISGVINLRGEIISATELATLMGVDGEAEGSVMIICDLRELTTGLVVHEVADIVEVPMSAVEPPLATLERVKAEYTVGQVAVDDRLVTILDLDRLLAPIGT